VQGDQETAAGGLRHLALLYQGTADYLAAVLGWIQAALARAEPVLVAVPGPASAQLRQDLGEG
jgi:MEDS: MEthanogen/methylotroph, DcmR Sensory domain